MSYGLPVQSPPLLPGVPARKDSSEIERAFGSVHALPARSDLWLDDRAGAPVAGAPVVRVWTGPCPKTDGTLPTSSEDVHISAPPYTAR